MKLRSIFIVLSLIVAQAISAFTPLDEVYNKLSKLPNVTKTPVKYTGTFDPKQPDMKGFMMCRNNGNGWTMGDRIQCENIDQDMAEAIFEAFDNNEEELGVVVKDVNDRACFDAKNKLGYAFRYNKRNKTAYFLKATVEDEICIPDDWITRNYYKGLEKRAVNNEFIPFNDHELSPTEWVASLAKLNTELKYNYVFYDRFKNDIDSAYQLILPLMANVKDNYEAVQLIKRFLASCHDGHTMISGLANSIFQYGSPFSTKLLDGRVYIDNIYATNFKDAGLKRGMELLEINDIPIHEHADSVVRPYVNASTPQWADHIIYDGLELTKGRAKEPANLTLSDGKDTIYIENWLGKNWGDALLSERETTNFKKLKGNIGMLRIPDFQSSSVTQNFDKVYNQILDTDALIIDIRANRGGNSGYADYVATHFSADSVKSDSWRTPVYNPAFASWGNPREWYVRESGYMKRPEGSTPYLKPIVILIDRGTFSAAEDFAALFKGMNRAKFVGNPTGGSTGNGVRIRLNDVVEVNICSKHDTAPDGTEFVGIGIIPDVVVNETPEQYFSGEDAYVEAALELLRQKLK